MAKHTKIKFPFIKYEKERMEQKMNIRKITKAENDPFEMLPKTQIVKPVRRRSALCSHNKNY